MMGLNASAYTEVPGFDGETWLDHAIEDDIFNPNFGDGSEGNPWKILSAEGLAYLALKVKEGNTYDGVYFEIAKDINLGTNGIVRIWVPIGPDTEHAFKGTIKNGSNTQGNPYVISGMTIRANGIGTTKNFGLFGVLYGKVEGLVIRNANITVNTDDDFAIGTLCGKFGTSEIGKRLGSVSRCTVEGTTITTSSSSSPAIGGLIGTVNEFTELTSNLARTTINATGPVHAGGVFGKVYVNQAITDCHAVVNMNVKNETASETAAGGVTGFCYGYQCSKTELVACSASGDIAVSGSGTAIIGGITGHARYLQKLSYCTTSVSLSGAHTMGGLIGFYEDMSTASSAGIFQCFCSSFVDAKKATYAGGMFGHLKFWKPYYKSNYWVGSIGVGQPYSTFAGTMTKPENTDSKYGIIVGYVEGDEAPDSFGYFKYDRQMCNLQLNGMGWNSERWGTGDYRLVDPFDSPKPQDGVYAYYQEAWMGKLAQELGGKESFYTANMKVACAPLIITNDYKYYFNAYDVTIDFLVEKFVNQTTGEELATYQLASPMPSCLELSDKKAKLLDPGEALVIVNCRGVQRKVHLDITYGQPWDGTIAGGSGNYRWNSFIGGDGTAKNPYVIHNAQELVRVMFNKADGYGKEYQHNVEGKHYILTNDIFLNNHLLQDNEEPREDAKTWNTYDWRAVLHGNGKTIYGLYLNNTAAGEGSTHGLFGTVTGSVEDLAVVDSYVHVKSTSEISSGILCGWLSGNGTIERCMVHGRVQSDGYSGGLCGVADGDTRISDCFSAAHVGWLSNPNSFNSAGMVYITPKELARCVSIGRVEKSNSADCYGLTQSSNGVSDCYFDLQMMSSDEESITTEFNKTVGSTFTKDLISGTTLKDNTNWMVREEFYPMLKQFAHTPYGELLSLPISFYYESDSKYDRAGSVNQIFDLPTENVQWQAYNGKKYLDVINECGAAAPNGKSTGTAEYLCVAPTNSKSACTKPLRVTVVNVDVDKAGIMFKDPEAEKACLAAFDNDHDYLVTLREAFETTDEEFKTFNDNAAKVESFTELRFFSKVVNLKEGMLSGLCKLKEIEFPKVLTTISTNAFNGCASLEEIEVPYLFNNLGEGGFYGSGIKNILVNSKSTKCKSIDGILYQIDSREDDKVMLMAYPPGRGEESATLSAPLTTILSNAIYKVPNLKNVYIDNCLPDGEMAELEEDGIIHEDPNDIMHVYVNDGSFRSSLFEDYCNDDMWSDPYLEEDHLDIYFPLNITSAGWATLYIDFPTQLPEGMSAYVAAVQDSINNMVTLKDIGRIIPASTPVAIKGAQGLYPLYRYVGSVPEIPKHHNKFIGSFIGEDNKWGVPVNQETSASGSILTLGHNAAGMLGFFKYNGEMIPPYRAYLVYNLVKEGPLQAAPAFRIVFDDETTGIRENSQRILTENVYYTIDGRKLQGKPTKRGLYIYNGKKIVIK